MTLLKRSGPIQEWRDLAKEIGVIVLGVLIALAADQGVDFLRWQESVRLGRTSLHSEIEFDDIYFQDRLRIAACIDRRLGQLSKIVDDVAAGNGEVPSIAINVHNPVRATLRSEWDAENASQVLTHFPRKELSQLGRWYDRLSDMRDWSARENEAWAQLGMLAEAPMRLTAGDIAQLRRAIAIARNIEWLTKLNARRQLQLSHELGVESLLPGRADEYGEANCAQAPPLQR